MFCWHICMCVHRMCVGPTEAIRWSRMPWGYRWLWSTMWVLGIEPMSSGRVGGTVCHCTVSPAHLYIFWCGDSTVIVDHETSKTPVRWSQVRLPTTVLFTQSPVTAWLKSVGSFRDMFKNNFCFWTSEPLTMFWFRDRVEFVSEIETPLLPSLQVICFAFSTGK